MLVAAQASHSASIAFWLAPVSLRSCSLATRTHGTGISFRATRDDDECGLPPPMRTKQKSPGQHREGIGRGSMPACLEARASNVECSPARGQVKFVEIPPTPRGLEMQQSKNSTRYQQRLLEIASNYRLTAQVPFGEVGTGGMMGLRWPPRRSPHSPLVGPPRPVSPLAKPAIVEALRSNGESGRARSRTAPIDSRSDGMRLSPLRWCR
jgi:hypothetical protein